MQVLWLGHFSFLLRVGFPIAMELLKCVAMLQQQSMTGSRCAGSKLQCWANLRKLLGFLHQV